LTLPGEAENTTMSIASTFGKNLQAARTELGWTQERLAAASGVPLGTIRDYEDGNCEPLLSTAWKLSIALGVSLDALADED
jgi:transcriptional regulator with XRE-family HTH domain